MRFPCPALRVSWFDSAKTQQVNVALCALILSSPPALLRLGSIRINFHLCEREMTKLRYDSLLHHPSHPHLLKLSDLSNSPVLAATLHPLCSGCNCRASGDIYSCEPCNFALHAPCAHMPPLITHPGHEKHPLKLLTAPAYACGWFNCDGCDQQGSGFSYHCAECSFDLHIVCASKPLRIREQSHCHELSLAFKRPYETGGFNCDVCRATGGNHWLYRCSHCNFDAHLECAVVARAGPVQVAPALQQASYTGAVPPLSVPSGFNHQRQYQTRAVFGQRNMQGAIYDPNGMNIGSSQHQAQPIMRPSATGFGAFSGAAAAAQRGLVEGVAQQLGQNLAQNVMGSGNSGGIFDFSSFLDF